MELNHYSRISQIFSYPSRKLKDEILYMRESLISFSPALMTKLEPFLVFVNTSPLSIQQEYYTSTFDVQPLSTLDVGYVLFGDDYRRGLFMVNIKKEQIKAGIDCGSELPDHLPNILALLPRMEEKLAEELVVSLLMPAVEEIVSRFNNSENYYKGPLEILHEIMKKDFSCSCFERFQVRIKNVNSK